MQQVQNTKATFFEKAQLTCGTYHYGKSKHTYIQKQVHEEQR